MGPEAVPYLVKELHWQPSPMMQSLHRRFPNFPLTLAYVQGATDPRGGAAYALGEIGPPAISAISNLQALSVVADLPSCWYVNMAAKAALIKIKREPLAPYIEEIRDTSDCLRWYPKALLLGQFGTNAAAAVPVLLAALNPTNNDIIHGHALIALGEIHSESGTCVPAIAAFLTSPSVSSRQKAITALAAFGSNAKPAVKEITTCLSDSDPWVRHVAKLTLKRVAGAAAVPAGAN